MTVTTEEILSLSVNGDLRTVVKTIETYPKTTGGRMLESCRKVFTDGSEEEDSYSVKDGQVTRKSKQTKKTKADPVILAQAKTLVELLGSQVGRPLAWKTISERQRTQFYQFCLEFDILTKDVAARGIAQDWMKIPGTSVQYRVTQPPGQRVVIGYDLPASAPEVKFAEVLCRILKNPTAGQRLEVFTICRKYCDQVRKAYQDRPQMPDLRITNQWWYP